MALTTFRNQGIQYSAVFFAEETIELMLQPAKDLPLGWGGSAKNSLA